MNKKLVTALFTIMTTIMIANPVNAQVTNYKEGVSLSQSKTKMMNDNPSKIWIVASESKYPDSLSAINMAQSKKGRIVLLNNISYKSVIEQINNNPSEICIIGGENSISKDIEKELKSVTKNIKRYAGKNRYETNKKTLRNFKNYVVASGEDFADAISAGNIVQNQNLGLYLIRKNDALPKNTVASVGGKDTITHQAKKAYFGKDRFKTSYKTLDQKNVDTVYASNGQDFSQTLLSYNLTDGKKKMILIEKNPANSSLGTNKVILPSKQKEFKLNIKKEKHFVNSLRDFDNALKKARDNYYTDNEMTISKDLLKNSKRDLYTIRLKHGVKMNTQTLHEDNDYITYKIKFQHIALNNQDINPHEMREAEIQLEKIIKKLNLKDKSSDKEKLNRLALYIQQHVGYNTYAADNLEDDPLYIANSKITSMFLQPQALCYGYTLGYTWILDKIGIESYQASVIQPKGVHSILKIKMDGKWQFEDVTPYFESADGLNPQDILIRLTSPVGRVYEEQLYDIEHFHVFKRDDNRQLIEENKHIENM